MKIITLFILLIALFLLYRIAYPRQSVGKKDNDAPSEKPKPVPEIVGKSRFVLPPQSQPLQTTAGSQILEKENEKPITFAPENEKNRSIAIPKEQLDEAFSDTDNGKIMSLPLETVTEPDIDLEAEEAEELNRTLGRQAVFADGIDFNDLQTIVKIIREQPDKVSEKTVDTIRNLEHTDMFEQLLAERSRSTGDEGKMNWIKAVVERSIQKTLPEAENGSSESSDNSDYGDFISDFLV